MDVFDVCAVIIIIINIILNRSYQSTMLYRELKLRSAILSSGQLKLLPKEQVYNSFNGVWNLSSDQGNLGTFIVTNVRLIWYADINETFNISLPHMQISSVSHFIRPTFQSLLTRVLFAF